MTVKVSVHSDLNSYPDIRSLALDFCAFKRGDYVPNYFGRDGDYRRPRECLEEEVWHLHLSEIIPPDHYWTRVKNIFNRTSNKHLVYCRGFFDPKHFFLITVLDPNAHEDARNIDRMRDIAYQAQEFRASY